MQPHERFFKAKPDFRDAYSRDRDRIIHCSSFRRLEYKTQVFLNSVGDFFRTRLTHSLEVSQIARAIARAIGLNEALCEAIALAHDLGHTPFGHAGGDELDSLLKQYSTYGFEHNFQSFRVVTQLEKRYADYDGLNLTFATLEGILKHSYPYKKKFLNEHINKCFRLDYHPSLEAIVVDHADEMAYISHDIDDGLKCGFLTMEHIRSNGLIKEVLKQVYAEGITQEHHVFRPRLVSLLINFLVFAFIEFSKKSPYLQQEEPICATLAAHIAHGIGFDEWIKRQLKELKAILYKQLYSHHEVKRKTHFGKRCIRALFNDFMNDIWLLPYQNRLEIQNDAKKQYRVVADYIAGMSDRFAIRLYQELHVG